MCIRDSLTADPFTADPYIHIYIYIQRHPELGSLGPPPSSRKATGPGESPGGPVRGVRKSGPKTDPQQLPNGIPKRLPNCSKGLKKWILKMVPFPDPSQKLQKVGFCLYLQYFRKVRPLRKG